MKKLLLSLLLAGSSSIVLAQTAVMPTAPQEHPIPEIKTQVPNNNNSKANDYSPNGAIHKGKEWCVKNPEDCNKLKEQRKEFKEKWDNWCKDNPVECQQKKEEWKKHKEFCENNKEECRKQMREWYEKNKTDNSWRQNDPNKVIR